MRAASIHGLGAVAILVGLVACASDRSPGKMAGVGGAGGTGGSVGGAATGGTTGMAGGGGVSTAGAGGGTGGPVGHCDPVPGVGGAGGASIAPGCDLDVARQALLALGIGTVGNASTATMPLPATLTDAQWSVKSEACRQGGYDLAPVAGMNVCLVSQVISGMCQGNPAKVYVLMSNGAVDCIYMAICPGSRIAPGVYSVVDPLCN